MTARFQSREGDTLASSGVEPTATGVYDALVSLGVASPAVVDLGVELAHGREHRWIVGRWVDTMEVGAREGVDVVLRGERVALEVLGQAEKLGDAMRKAANALAVEREQAERGRQP